jgi:hypothetical protein
MIGVLSAVFLYLRFFALASSLHDPSAMHKAAIMIVFVYDEMRNSKIVLHT